MNKKPIKKKPLRTKPIVKPKVATPPATPPATPKRPKLPSSTESAVEKCSKLALSVLKHQEDGEKGLVDIISAETNSSIEDLSFLLSKMNEQWLEDVINELCRLGFIRYLHEIIVYMEANSSTSSDKIATAMIDKIFEIVQIATRHSRHACEILADEGMIPVLVNNITNEKTSKSRLLPNTDDATSRFIVNNLTVISKLALLPLFKSHFFKAYAVKAVKLYFDSKSEKIEILAYMTFASLQGGSAMTFVEHQDSALEHLVDYLRMAVNSVPNKNGHHFPEGLDISAEELMACLNVAATNDANKIVLFRKQLVDILEIILRKSGNVNVQTLAIDLLHCVAFSPEIRQFLIKDRRCLAALDKLAKHYQNLPPNTELTKATRKTALALFYFNTNLEEIAKEANANIKSENVRLFLSCSPINELTLLEIKRRLAKNGFIATFSVEFESNFADITKTIQESLVVLICYSEEYYCTNSCRTEAEIISAFGKPIIPVCMQKDYQAAGWLQQFATAGRSIDFSLAKDHFNTAYTHLSEEILYRVEKLSIQS